MKLEVVAQYATELLATVLIFRLLRLRDRSQSVYVVFVAFLLIQLLGPLSYFACQRWPQVFDYRIVWLVFTGLLTCFSLWLVYSLARAVLEELPGILRFSRILLNVIFPLAILAAFSTSKSEYWLEPANNTHERVDKLIHVFYIVDKGISLSSTLVLLVILAFILWFPVKMSKNLAMFSIGLVVYFASKAGLELLGIYQLANREMANIVSVCISGVLLLCFVYWIVFIDLKGRTEEVRMGHGWHQQEQQKMIAQLEALNGVLMRSSQQLRSTERLPL